MRRVGIELVVVPLAGYSIHIDGHLGMLASTRRWSTCRGCRTGSSTGCAALGIEPIPCPPGEEWAINSLVLRPGAC